VARSPDIDLVRDVLDIRLRDRGGRSIGRVDGIVLEIRDDGPPRVAAMEVGVLTLARRVSPRLARWMRRFAARWLRIPLGSVRLPLTLFRDVGVDIELDVDAERDRRLLRVEKWLRRRVVRRIPGSGA
jgi:hypothetical protein